MAGIYLHIPFCKKACHYCNFHFSTSSRLQQPLVQALLKEIELQKQYLTQPVETIYFGGGTPSILPAENIAQLLHFIHLHFTVTPGAEITLEANPDDITGEKLEAWKHAGINRLSIGIQSFSQADLDWMNRAHNAQQATACINLAKQHGFSNLTIDLIYGTPTLSDAQWQQNVAMAIELGIPHLSCYALTVESKTALEKLIQKKKLAAVENEKQAHHFELLMQWMEDAGYEQYEISNFAKPGYRSRHNSSYWQGTPYLGIGPSAHSYNGSSRQWNAANNALYIKTVEQGIVPFEIEHLTTKQQVNEYIMTALRTMEGISTETLKKFGSDVFDNLLVAAEPHLARHHLVHENGSLKTTGTGKLLADGIAADLFV